jgi:glutathione S-transferase
MNELITIPMSHYCEKVRWALDRLGVAYREDRHLQLFHYAYALWRGRTVYVPVLVTPGGAIADSTRILQHLDRSAPEALRLYPDAPGPRSRRSKSASTKVSAQRRGAGSITRG